MTDENNRRTAVQIDLKLFAQPQEDVEDLIDVLVAESRRDEPTSSLEDVLKRIESAQKEG